MSIVLDPHEPAINRGIKTVGVGKKGSKPLTEELALQIVEDIKANRVSPAAKGAFIAGLLAKGVEPSENVIAEAFEPGVFENPVRLVDAVAGDAPDFVRWICVQLLNGQILDQQTAYDLGKFLFSAEPGDGARGLVASFLRVRYETADEYEGLLRAITDTLKPGFREPPPEGRPIIQISEPFDGVDHSYMITPMLAYHFQTLGYRAIHMLGKNSGPKFEMNLWDIAQALGLNPVQSNDELGKESPPMGWVFHQSYLSEALDRWVPIRHQTIKRPFLSTLERFLNPACADILIASAFHPPYGEKMLTIAERAGFKGIIIVRNGIEGTIAFPLKRPVKILLSKLNHGSYHRHEINFDVEQFLGSDIPMEERIDHPKAADNVDLIKKYMGCRKSGNEFFDSRIRATIKGLDQSLEWIKEGHS